MSKRNLAPAERAQRCALVKWFANLTPMKQLKGFHWAGTERTLFFPVSAGSQKNFNSARSVSSARKKTMSFS
jgi:hypothetical protein